MKWLRETQAHAFRGKAWDYKWEWREKGPEEVDVPKPVPDHNFSLCLELQLKKKLTKNDKGAGPLRKKSINQLESKETAKDVKEQTMAITNGTFPLLTADEEWT